jgi:hypothetical protein
VVETPTLFVEYLYTYVLLFTGDHKSEEIARKRFKINVSLIREFRDQYSPVRRQLRLQDFPVYGPQLDQIRRRMSQWRPTGLWDFRFRPYHDPLSFYAFWFGTLLGSIGILSLGLSIAQTYATLAQMAQTG